MMFFHPNGLLDEFNLPLSDFNVSFKWMNVSSKNIMMVASKTSCHYTATGVVSAPVNIMPQREGDFLIWPFCLILCHG